MKWVNIFYVDVLNFMVIARKKCKNISNYHLDSLEWTEPVYISLLNLKQLVPATLENMKLVQSFLNSSKNAVFTLSQESTEMLCFGQQKSSNKIVSRHASLR